MSGHIPDLKPEDEIGKYKILSKLGKGTFATPYLAEQKLIKRRVVIRLFTTTEQNILELARREAEILASINHPHIVELHDADEYEGFFYQVIEYVDGKLLSGMIEAEDELPVTVVLKLMSDIADALDNVHSLGIVHGNVEPTNIMVSSKGSPMLMDFTLAGAAPDQLVRDKILSQIPYVAPECWRQAREKRSDLWAFGMTLHYLLTRHIPFKTTDVEEVRRIVTSPMPLDLADLRESAPEPVVRIVERCLQKDLSKRYQSAAEIRRDLESAIAYLELGQSEIVATTVVSLHPGHTLLLNVEYKEPGISGQYREYRIKEALGQGSFSTVYQAEDVIGNRHVALKILRQERARDEKILFRFRQEASLLTRLDHPNIVRVYNFGRYIADFFIVMEVLMGPTIKDALDGGFDFQIEYVVAIVAQVLAGLERIHAEGVIHRDVKPENIKLQPERTVVMDLGLAHISGDAQLTMSGEIFGTPRYMAPEQARGENVTFQSDLYAAGVVLYELLTGKIPHKGDDTAGLIFRIALEEPDPITKYRGDLPSSLVAYLSRILARDPTKRFSSTRLAYEELLASIGLQSYDVLAIHRNMSEKLEATLSQ
ncbi:MAG: serine/threonine protein kinase [Nitrososphaera sp.]|nr:serine/threonine protein kinase [Nitrososphaera sp.]